MSAKGHFRTLAAQQEGHLFNHLISAHLRAAGGARAFDPPIHPSAAEQLTFVIVRALIIIFLVLEPNGQAVLGGSVNRVDVWPFP
jgi:hypothetical protein